LNIREVIGRIEYLIHNIFNVSLVFVLKEFIDVFADPVDVEDECIFMNE
jgi:hypothetical protein